MIFYRISELILATFIQRYDKNSFYFKNETLTAILNAIGAALHDWIKTIRQFIKPFFDNKMSILRNMEPLIINNLHTDQTSTRVQNGFEFMPIKAEKKNK